MYRKRRKYKKRKWVRNDRLSYTQEFSRKKRLENIIWKLKWYLKKKQTIIFLVALGVFIPWFLFLLISSPLQLQVYQDFLSLGFVIFLLTFIGGLALGTPPKE